MRILHFADLHLGVETYGRVDPATGMSTRLGDFLSALDEVVDYATDEDIDLMLFCGDAYKNRDPGQTCQREFARRIKRLSDSGIPVFLLVGNHDLPNAVGRATAVEIFDTLSVNSVTVAGRPGTHRMHTKNGSLQIVALPWARRNALLTREDLRGLSSHELNEKLQAILTNWLDAEVAHIDPDVPAILAAHVAHSGAVAGSEYAMVMGRDYVIMQSTIANPAFDYVALGHMHNRQVIENPVPAVYPGSLQAIDFGDEGQEKGFYVVELDGSAGRGARLKSYDFHPVKTRQFLTIDVEANTEDPTAAVLDAIGSRDVKDAIVRVRITISGEKEGLLRDSEIRKALGDAHYVAAVSKDVQRTLRSRAGGRAAESMSPLEALELYWRSKQTPDERIKTLLKHADELIIESSGPTH
jgi:exonuclease SbcD